MFFGGHLKCRVCGHDKENQSYDVKEMMIGYRDLFRYFQCSRCLCLQIGEIPPDLSKYYPDTYYSYHTDFYQNKLKKVLVGLRDSYLLGEGGFIGKILSARYPREDLLCFGLVPGWRQSSILDVGCGSGTLLYSLREAGVKKLLGVDPFVTKDIEYPNGLRVQKNELFEVEGTWDIVMFHHSFEHVSDPVKTFENVARLLALKGGRCIIRIPTVSSYAWSHYGVHWVQLDAPRHLFLHSIESMKLLADKSGLVLDNVVYDSTAFQFWGSEQYKKDIPLQDKRSYLKNRKKSLFSKVEISAFAERARDLNRHQQGDQAVFIFKKT
jgi:SAM-dependent methyltransferase